MLLRRYESGFSNECSGFPPQFEEVVHARMDSREYGVVSNAWADHAIKGAVKVCQEPCRRRSVRTTQSGAQWECTGVLSVEVTDRNGERPRDHYRLSAD